ncbi:methyltransferase regulatory domain-containing protein [Pusillimonas sp. CC-YST705]|uniref:Methyltransferase regulatory domain-containing protein n=1 Tax=Mesopusillimonas faecipullorum TaxID=2755040 RepID=A0ABS8CDY3_9BURK|nr:methyltransferase regulatory domain-containing protein [Mesopusillimonas faecipullorum]MCB5364238.1 methyltransferase regulatory domain-containing protein [Mesopusillimonas faecipullorum]
MRKGLQAGVSYIGSANCLENMDALSIPSNVQGLLAKAPSRRLKETLRDVARNQNQRVDVFQKQPRTLDPETHLQVLNKVVFTVLATLPAPGAIEFDTPIGGIPGPAEIFALLISQLKAGNQTFAELHRLPLFKQEPGLLLQTLNMLMWAGYVQPMRQEQQPAPGAARLQAWMDKQKIPLRVLPECGSAVQV